MVRAQHPDIAPLHRVGGEPPRAFHALRAGAAAPGSPQAHALASGRAAGQIFSPGTPLKCFDVFLFFLFFFGGGVGRGKRRDHHIFCVCKYVFFFFWQVLFWDGLQRNSFANTLCFFLRRFPVMILRHADILIISLPRTSFFSFVVCFKLPDPN